MVKRVSLTCGTLCQLNIDISLCLNYIINFHTVDLPNSVVWILPESLTELWDIFRSLETCNIIVENQNLF